MKRFVIITFELVCSFVLQAQNNYFKPGHSTIIDSSKGDMMIHQSRLMPRISGFWNVTEKEIDLLEINFKKLSAVDSSFCESGDCKLDSLHKFVYQYIGVIYQGRKLVYINAFRFRSDSDLKTRFGNWKTNPVRVLDGGNSYWGVLFDIDRQEFIHLSFNGEA